MKQRGGVGGGVFGVWVRRRVTGWTVTWLCGEVRMRLMITVLCFSHCCAR